MTWEGFFCILILITVICVTITQMGRILGIDYGKKRSGVSATDISKIIVTGIGTYETNKLMDFLIGYIQTEKVEKIVFGLPVHKDGNFTLLKVDIDKFVANFKKQFPEIEVDFADESYTSSDARSIIFQSGIGKKKRRNKALVDKVSAVLILQRYLNHI